QIMARTAAHLEGARVVEAAQDPLQHPAHVPVRRTHVLHVAVDVFPDVVVGGRGCHVLGHLRHAPPGEDTHSWTPPRRCEPAFPAETETLRASDWPLVVSARMPLVDYLVGVFFFGVIWGAAGFVAWTVVRRQLPAFTGALGVLAFALLFVAALVLFHLIPGALGVLSRVSVLVTAILATLLCLRIPRR